MHLPLTVCSGPYSHVGLTSCEWKDVNIRCMRYLLPKLHGYGYGIVPDTGTGTEIHHFLKIYVGYNGY